MSEEMESPRTDKLLFVVPEAHLKGGRDIPYLAAVGTLSEDNVEALPAGRKRSQPLEKKDR